MLDLAVTAIKNGYYHFDCAEGKFDPSRVSKNGGSNTDTLSAYFNETGIGAGIKASGVEREKMFIASKAVGSHGQDIQSALEISLEKLDVDYLDLYYIHIPWSAQTDEELQRIWAEMEKIKESGKARSIGVSNFDKEHLEIILRTAKIVPAINQIEYHPYRQYEDLIPFMREKGIAIAAYSGLTPILAARPGPLDDTYAELAAKYGVTEADIEFRWLLDQDIVVITTSKKEERIQQYLTSLPGFRLEEEDFKRITETGKQKTYKGPYEEFMRKYYCF